MSLPPVLQAFFSKDYWCHTIWNRETVRAVLATVGALWLLVQVVNFFVPLAGTFLKEHWEWLAGAVPFVTLYLRKPVVAVAHQLAGRDIRIEVRIGDLLKMPGDHIITSNTTFDTSPSIIADNSIQGQFTKKVYDGNDQHLDTDIDEALSETTLAELNDSRRGKRKRYPIGTVVKVAAKGKTSYLLAAVHMNEHGNCDPANFDQVKTVLASLWGHIGQRGDRGRLVIGLIGTGRGRLPTNRMEVAREIVQSFIAACSESTFSDGLTVAIHPSDYRKNNMNIRDLGDYLRHVCRYSNLERVAKTGSGTGII